jgi:hypothetical protein
MDVQNKAVMGDSIVAAFASGGQDGLSGVGACHQQWCQVGH